MADDVTGSSYRALLNAIPLWAFVVDGDLRVQDLNDAAAAAFAPDKIVVLDQQGGEVLNCLRWQESLEGCGHGPFCPDCVIRNAVGESLRGGHVRRRRARVTLVSAGLKKDCEVLVTANPMPGSAEPLSLLVIEDVSEISALRDILPICSKCRTVRDDPEYWWSVQSYFREHRGQDFSHGACPSCQKDLNPAAADD